jgi:hypothetical protein
MTVRSRSLVTLSAVGLWTVGGLWWDSRIAFPGQLLLGALTLVVLAALLVLQTPAVRAQALLVVVVATAAEVVGSLIWGVYQYRLDNLPAFVPPGHGLVYLGGVAIAALAGKRGLLLVVAATASVASWGILGVTALSTTDAAGSLGCATLATVLVLTRRPVYAGVFFVVAALELYGTALGTWTWEATVPGLGIPQGNPPSGVASGYVLFDVAALVASAKLAGLGGRHQRVRRCPGESRTDPSGAVARDRVGTAVT